MARPCPDLHPTLTTLRRSQPEVIQAQLVEQIKLMVGAGDDILIVIVSILVVLQVLRSRACHVRA